MPICNTIGPADNTVILVSYGATFGSVSYTILKPFLSVTVIRLPCVSMVAVPENPIRSPVASTGNAALALVPYVVVPVAPNKAASSSFALLTVMDCLLPYSFVVSLPVCTSKSIPILSTVSRIFSFTSAALIPSSISISRPLTSSVPSCAFVITVPSAIILICDTACVPALATYKPYSPGSISPPISTIFMASLSV